MTSLCRAESIISSPVDTLSTSNPLEIENWDALIAPHKQATVFHSRSWARVLAETYGHTPLYVGGHSATEVISVLPLMEVRSPWTGRRGVSLPFSDFCDPLAPGPDLYSRAIALGRERQWKYLECRGDFSSWPNAKPSGRYWSHALGLQPGPGELFNRFSPAVRRAIRKAETLGLKLDFGNSLECSREFYSLHCLTRRRHGVPPQPYEFFQNITRYLLGVGHGFIVVARQETTPVAAAVFLHFGKQAVYKFGASHPLFQQSRPNNLVMWAAIRRLAEQGFDRLHFGRTSLDNEGLRRFKLGFGAEERALEYCRYDFRRNDFVQVADRAGAWHNHVFRLLPPGMLKLAGRLLYPHLS